MNNKVSKQKIKINHFFRPKLSSVLLANLVGFAIFGYCFWLVHNNNDFYLSIAGEDDFIEWSTMWSFLMASIGCVFGAILGYNQFKKFEWFYVGLALFCFIVAMEEISWGQRLFGYIPPNYFLENNFQQELTFHNMMGISLRKIILKTIALGYGVILPLSMLIPSMYRLLSKLRVVVPPLELIPSFLLVFFLNKAYPWILTDEVVELILGVCFLSTVLFRLLDFKSIRNRLLGVKQLIAIILIVLVALLLGLISAQRSDYNTMKSNLALDTCRMEIEAIKKDFIVKINETGKLPFQNYIHKRVYSTVKKYKLDWLNNNEFAKLTKQGKAQNRAKFFIDSWNMPYWVLFLGNKENGRKRFVIYSFGPNRKRDSNDWTLRGDDVGVILFDTGLKKPYIPENEIVP